METLLYEEVMKTETRMQYEKDSREQERDRLVQIVTRNSPSVVGTGWALVTTGLGRLAGRGSEAVRQALRGSSQPSEQCC